MTTPPRVTVVIPTYNRRERLARVITALEGQTCGTDAFDVVIVSDGSTDGTDEFLAKLQTPLRVTVERQANAGPAAARNRGVQLATAPLVLFVDDDVIAMPELVAEHLRLHERDDDLVVIGPMITPPDHKLQFWVAWEQAMLYKQYEQLDSGAWECTHRQFYTGNASAPRARLLEAGLFDTRFRRAEDVELAYRLHRLGVRFAYNGRAVGHHYAERPFASWLRTAYDYGACEVIFGCELGQDPTLGRVHREYTERHPLIKLTSRLLVGVPGLSKVADPALRAIAAAGDRFDVFVVSRLALSVLYNGAYYRGLADRLGGRAAFERTLVRGLAPSQPAPGSVTA